MAHRRSSDHRRSSREVARSRLALGVVALVVIVLAGCTAAVAGNNGTLKIHEQGTPPGTEDNDPKVCVFNVEGFGLDPGQAGYLSFAVQGGDGPTGAPAGPFAFGPADENGYWASQYFSLVDGHYKATLYGRADLTDEKAKSKVFKVECAAPTPTPTATATPTTTPTATPPPTTQPTATPTATPGGQVAPAGSATASPSGEVEALIGTSKPTPPPTDMAPAVSRVPVAPVALLLLGLALATGLAIRLIGRGASVR